MKEPYEKAKEPFGASDESEDSDFLLVEENESEISEVEGEGLETSPPRSAKRAKRHQPDWRRRLEDYFDAKRIRELLDDDIESDPQDPLYKKSSLDSIIDDLHHQDEE